MRLYSTYHKRPVRLPPRGEGLIGIYVCGPTVYQRAHIGNARPYIVFSWLARWLREIGYQVRFVHNITDVNDKIYEAAPGHSAERAQEATQWYLKDVGRFGLDEVDAWPKATEYIEPIKDFVARLIQRDYAYVVGGDVYFRARRFSGYGRLSGQRLDKLRDQEPNPKKRDPLDFALWKETKPGEDTSWPSQWGLGRPGWHIECSVMAEAELGPIFEIHGGGLDLVFPHHENERAQSRALGHRFARIWMHNGLLRFVGEKMSKSVGNTTTIQEAFEVWTREVLLIFFLTAHWRSPIDYSDEALTKASQQWLTFLGTYHVPNREPPPSEWRRLVKVLRDDFNTPAALDVLHGWRSQGYWYLVDRGLNLFGLSLPPMAGTRIVEERLLRDRERARQQRDWSTADDIRDALWDRGFEVLDETTGPRLVPRR